jgi:hypothetical protein
VLSTPANELLRYAREQLRIGLAGCAHAAFHEPRAVFGARERAGDGSDLLH